VAASPCNRVSAAALGATEPAIRIFEGFSQLVVNMVGALPV
jgi:hypothetical protein